MAVIKRIGRISLEQVGTGSLRLRWKFNNRQYTLPVADRKSAEAKAQLISSDITYDRFDATLAKYGKAQATKPLREAVSLQALWKLFLADKLTTIKPTTAKDYADYEKILVKLDLFSLPISPQLAITIKQASLAEGYSQDTTSRLLGMLGTCFLWAINNELLAENLSQQWRFARKGLQCGKVSPIKNTKPIAFSEDEQEAIMLAFSELSNASYHGLVCFWLLTGCRPSEGIGLQWKHLSEDCSIAYIRGSIQDGAWINKSKNNTIRDIILSARLTKVLQALPRISEFVFASPRSNSFIDYYNFVSDIWHKTVEPIVGKPTTPYNCRDTFITNNLRKGTPMAIIAAYCDTSETVIRQRYLDSQALLSGFKPQ